MNTLISKIVNLTTTVLFLNIVLAFYFLIKSTTEIKSIVAHIRKQSLILLLLIFIFSFYIRAYLIPHQHFMWIDESWNLEVAKNFILRGKAELCTYVGIDEIKCNFYPKPVGFPYVLSWFLMFFGMNDYTGIYMTVFLGSLSCILVFFIAYVLSNSERVGLLSALAFTLMPAHLYWSGSSESNVTSVFLNLASLLVFLLFIKSERWLLYFLAISLLSLSIQIVPTDGLLIPLAGIAFLLYGTKKISKLRDTRFWAGIAMLIVLTAPHFLHMANVLTQTTEYLCEDVCYEGMVTLKQFKQNWPEWGVPQFMDRMRIPTFINISILLGVVYSLKRRRLFLFLALWFLLFYLINMAYWDPQDRKFLNVLPALAIFYGIGISGVIDSLSRTKVNRKMLFAIFSILILLSFYSGVERVINSDNPINVAEITIPQVVNENLSEEAYLIAEWPTVFLSTTNIKGMRTSNALHKPEIIDGLLKRGTEVYFLEDMYCQPPSYKQALDNCREFMSEYDTERYLEIRYLNVNFYIHKVTRKGE